MLERNYFLIHLVIVILSIILSYITYRYLNYDLIDISKFVKNDIENFTIQLDLDYFVDEESYSVFKTDAKMIQDKIDASLSKDTFIRKEFERVNIYNR